MNKQNKYKLIGECSCLTVLNIRKAFTFCLIIFLSDGMLHHLLSHFSNETLILNLKQLTLDIHFLLEIAKWGGYLSDTIMNAYLDSESRMKSVFLSAGMDLER